VPVTQCTSIEAIEALKNKQIQIFTTFMDGSISAYHADFTQGTALVVGTEHEGVSDQWRGVGQNINLPMLGVIDSLNVSVAAAVLMYEAIRQRQFR
jgi:TrmH family RNA methyltransferase